MKLVCKYKEILLVSLVVSVIFFSSCEKKNEILNGKITCVGDECKKQLILALEDLSKIEMSDGLTETQIDLKHKEIQSVVNRFDNPQDISGLALLSKSMARHCSISDVTCSKTSKLISTYDSAFWDCIKKLSIKKEENKKVLDELKFLSQLSGTDVGDWGRIVDGKEFP
ncbi:hypothetical protein BH10ACI1_BH10ACI1_35260 [soil metagenome]